VLPEQRFDAPFVVYRKEDAIRAPISDDGIAPRFIPRPQNKCIVMYLQTANLA
jgi:hypothetical protein